MTAPRIAAVILTAGAMGAFLPRSPALAQELPDHAPFTRILEQVVARSSVDYLKLAGLRRDLDRYIATLGTTTAPALEGASRNERLAFWINAYNACMLKVVLDHYPIRRGGAGILAAIRNWFAGYPSNSVWQIPNVFGREHCPVVGSLRSQDEIEHEIIRPTFQDPRIHFAVNCAARSCPVLWPEAYEGDRLDAQLDRSIRALVGDPAHFRMESGPPATLHLNKVLDWYQDDFGGLAGVKAFFADYVGDADRARLSDPDTAVSFFEYDWTLNDVAR
jgi:hypothetical protein